MKPLSIILTFLLLPALAYAHSGGLDKYGGHYNRKTGEYHCHKEPCFNRQQQHTTTECHYASAIDGDTIRIVRQGKLEKVRLIGVNTPERGQPGYDEAKAFTASMLKDKAICLEFDIPTRDKYGRLLAYVYLPDGRMLNEELIRAGHSKVYTKYPFKHMMRFISIDRPVPEKKD